MAQNATKKGKEGKPKAAPKALTANEMEDLKKAQKVCQGIRQVDLSKYVEN